MRHLRTIADLRREDVLGLITAAANHKATRGRCGRKSLDGKSVGMIFSKTSTRTRVSFEVAVFELGGFPMFFNAGELQLGKKESVSDTAKVLTRYLHAIVIRTYEQAEVDEFARHSTIPVINALTNEHHPCQALTDVFTVHESIGRVEGVKMVFLGDGASNMTNSLMMTAKLMGMEMVVCSPEAYRPDESLMKASAGTGTLHWEIDPRKAVEGADFIYTDVWVSMGFEEESKNRVRAMEPYRLDGALLARAPRHCKVLHCLPANRGMEITDEVLDGPQSIVFDQAENRLHTQKAILELLMG